MVWSRATVADEVVEVDILIDVHFLTHAVSGAEDTCFRDSETQGDFIGVLVKIDQHAQQFVGGSERGEVLRRSEEKCGYRILKDLRNSISFSPENITGLSAVSDSSTIFCPMASLSLALYCLISSWRFSIGIFVSFCRLSRSSILCLSLWR